MGAFFSNFLSIRPDIAFQRDDAVVYIPWIAALMIGMIALLLLGGISLGTGVASGSAGTGHTISIYFGRHHEQLQTSVNKVTALLSRKPELSNVRRVADDEIAQRLKPWFNAQDMLDPSLLPVIIEANISGRDANATALAEEIRRIAPEAEIDGHDVWAQKLRQLNAVLRGGMFLLALFLFASLTALMVFLSRTSLRLHAPVVTLLHAIGADDRYIIAQFQRNAVLLALRGAIIGSALGGVTFWLLGTYLQQLDAVLLPTLRMSGLHLLALLLLPLLCVLLASLSARISVRRQLEAHF